MSTQNKPVKIVGLANILEGCQKRALDHANALEKEIQEKGLDAVVKRLKQEKAEA
jgi:hypothetical protein